MGLGKGTVLGVGDTVGKSFSSDLFGKKHTLSSKGVKERDGPSTPRVRREAGRRLLGLRS